MTAQHQRLDGHQQRLDPQQQRMDQANAVHHMERDRTAGAGVLCRDFLVIAGIGVDDAAAARRHVGKTVFVEGLEERENGAGLGGARIDQLLAAAELTGRSAT